MVNIHGEKTIRHERQGASTDVNCQVAAVHKPIVADRLDGDGLRRRILREWSAQSDWWTLRVTEACQGHRDDEHFLEMTVKMDEGVQVGMFPVPGNVGGKHDTVVSSYQTSTRSPSLLMVTRVERSRR